MNIEETTENLKKYISFSEKECNFPSTWDWNWHKDLANDIETLLTAYEKEKEKREKLEYEALEAKEYIKRLKECHLQFGEITEKKRWKDKIKAKIEELEKLDFGTDLVSQFTANLTTITILQSLLEKE